MPRSWPLQEAKNKLSEVVDEAVARGPQVITRRGVETAVVLAYAEFRKLTLGRQKLSEFFRASPLVGVDLDLARARGPARGGPALLDTCSTRTASPNSSRSSRTGGSLGGSTTSTPSLSISVQSRLVKLPAGSKGCRAPSDGTPCRLG